MVIFDDVTFDLVPHCASVPPESWTGDHLIRPLSETGLRQAETLAGVIGPDIEAICSSPARRCRQTVEPLARITGLPVVEFTELLDTRGFAEPGEWTTGIFEPIGQAIAGAWAAGRGIRALTVMAEKHPKGRTVLASHGDVIPALLVALCAAHDAPLPRIVGRGGWYRVRFVAGDCAITSHGAGIPTA